MRLLQAWNLGRGRRSYWLAMGLAVLTLCVYFPGRELPGQEKSKPAESPKLAVSVVRPVHPEVDPVV